MADFESILEKIGSFGPFQWFLIAILWGLVSPFLAFSVFANFMLLLTPNHWCSLPQAEQMGVDFSAEDVRTRFLPTENGYKHSRCKMYAGNITHFLLNDSMRMTDEARPTVGCLHGWSYDYSVVYRTLVSEMNWVCENEWKAYTGHTILWLGSSVGVVFLGFLADRFGRVPVIAYSHAVSAVVGILTCYAQNYPFFLVLRFVMGFVLLSQSITTFVLVMEYVSADKRLTVSTGFLISYAVTGAILPWVAYIIRDWRKFNMAMSVPLLIVPFLSRWLPESVRWRVQKGHLEDVRKVLKDISRYNGKQVSDEYFSQIEVQVNENQKTLFHMFSYFNLSLVLIFTYLSWIFVCMGYTGGYIYAATVSKNPFLMLFLNSILDIIANVLADRLANKLGRKFATIASCMLATIGYSTCAAIPETMTNLSISCLIISRLCFNVGYNVHYLYAAEVYPTVVRNQALSLRQSLGSVGNFLSPQIVQLASRAHYLPLLVFASLSACTAALMVFLPETRNKPLPETFEEAENLGKQHYGCCVFFHSNKQARDDDGIEEDSLSLPV